MADDLVSRRSNTRCFALGRWGDLVFCPPQVARSGGAAQAAAGAGARKGAYR